MITEKTIQAKLFPFIVWKLQHQCVLNNVRIGVQEFDMISINKNRKIVEWEIKISRSDFLNDKKKRKWRFRENGYYCPDYTNYVVPKDLIKSDELSDGFGLFYLIQKTDQIL